MRRRIEDLVSMRRGCYVGVVFFSEELHGKWDGDRM